MKKTEPCCLNPSNSPAPVDLRLPVNRRSWRGLWPLALLILAAFCGAVSSKANIAGGGDGSGANVTVVNNGDGTVTMANGIVSIVININDTRLVTINYTYNNNGSPRTTNVLSPSNGVGRETYSFGGTYLGGGNNTYTYILAIDPASNGGARGDVEMLSSAGTNGTFEAHYTMQRGSPGFYTTAIDTHRSTDAASTFGVFGMNSTIASLFNWISADAARNFFIGQQPSGSAPVPVTASHEMKIDLNGGLAGQYDDKFMWGQDHSDEKAWGWSSVGASGNNIGVWVMTNIEFSDGGPLKHDDTVYSYNALGNQMMTGELNQGGDGNLAAGEPWVKTAGPFFFYMNNVSSSITDANQAAQALFSDATAQDAAEKAAWPYSWFSNPDYVSASGRGTVKGQIKPSDPRGTANPTVAGTWIGLEEQPITDDSVYDFQKWQKAYQFWTQTDSGGNFTFNNVIAGSNYTLYAYGPGVAGTFISQNQTAQPGGGPVDPPLEVDLPSTPFGVTVTAGNTTTIPQFTWTGQRVGSTVFDLGYPDRKADKYRHGEDYWAGQMPPRLGFPTGIWGAQVYFTTEYPSTVVNYTAGTSRWTTDWNYVLPSQEAPNGASYEDASGVINFNLANAPGVNDQGSIYFAGAGNYGASNDITVKVNGTTLDPSSIPGCTAAPNAITAGSFNPPSGYEDDSSVHCSDHGPFWDERITFPASLLRSGANTVTILNHADASEGYLMVDYLRLELTNYVPPTPASVTPYAGNNRNLVTWPLVPGATRYAVLRSGSPTSGFTTLAGGVLGTVSGSGPSIMTYTDTSAVNNTNYYYEVESLNPAGASAPTGGSRRATPSSTLPSSAPAAPTGLTVNSTGNGSVSLVWNTASDASYCNLYRTTLHSNGVGGTYGLRTILVQDANIGDRDIYNFTDTTPTNGTEYSYYAEAINAAGTSAASSSVTATPLAPAPASAPGSLTAVRASGTSVKLAWNAVTNATGYAIYRSTTSGGPFAFPTNFVNGTPLLVYTDNGLTSGTTYYYQVTAVNAAGISSPASATASP